MIEKYIDILLLIKCMIGRHRSYNYHTWNTLLHYGPSRTLVGTMAWRPVTFSVYKYLTISLVGVFEPEPTAQRIL